MNTKHTPGPWQWTTSGAGPEDEYGSRTRGPIDFNAWVSKGYYENPELASGDNVILSAGSGEYCPVHGNTLEERNANARLIAAAPDLLEALRAFNDAYSFISEAAPEPLNHAVRKARSAIAKAAGG